MDFLANADFPRTQPSRRALHQALFQGPGFSQTEPADYTLFKILQAQVAKLWRNLRPDYFLVSPHSKTWRTCVLGKSIQLNEMPGRETQSLKVVSCLCGLINPLPGLHINTEKPGHQPHRIADHIVICFFIHKSNECSML